MKGHSYKYELVVDGAVCYCEWLPISSLTSMKVKLVAFAKAKCKVNWALFLIRGSKANAIIKKMKDETNINI